MPLALTRMRLLTAVFPDYVLRYPEQGPAGGFLYARHRNGKGEDVGGIVPRLTLEAIAKDRPAEEVVLVDRPEVATGRLRLSGAFSVEGFLPAVGKGAGRAEAESDFAERMREVLRLSPVFEAGEGRRIRLQRIRRPDPPSALGAEAEVAGRRVGIAFAPENEPIGEGLVREAAREAGRKGCRDLYLLGFAIDAAALERVRRAVRGGRRLFYVQASLDLLMGGVLKASRSSQLFWLSGSPEIRVRRRSAGDAAQWVVGLVGLSRWDPKTETFTLQKAEELPAWFLDTDYDGCCFRPNQAFFPRTGAWEGVRRALGMGAGARGTEGRTSLPFSPGEHRRIAVKTLDRWGTELLVVRALA